MTVAAVQLFLAHRYYGFLGGDDVEVLEEAFRRAIGVQHQPWDIRNLFVPDFIVAPFVWLAHAAGVGDRRALIEVAAWPFIAISVATIVLVYELASRWCGDDRAAFVGAAIFALHWIPLGFGSTVYPRTLATASIVLAALIVDRYPFAAGTLIALAFADRFSEIVFLIPLLIIAKARWRVIAGALAGVLVFVGLYDWITWGAPFRSLINFAHLTLAAPDFASRVKYQPVPWYIGNILHWCAPTLLVLMAYGRRSTRWSFIVVPLVLLSAVRHKELRYLQAMIPFIAISAACGFAVLWQRGRRAIAIALAVLSIAWDLYGIREFAHKTMPAVMAAQAIDRQPRIRDVAVPQGWAFGGKLYFHRPVTVIEVGTPPHTIPNADALAMYETDLDDPRLVSAMAKAGFRPERTFRDGSARAVVLYMH